jgi:hypothetical protein
VSTPLPVYPDPYRPFCYEVQSAAHPHLRYRVQLLFNGGAGWCQCADFTYRRQEALYRGEPALTTATTCIHLRAAHRHYLMETLKERARLQFAS